MDLSKFPPKQKEALLKYLFKRRQKQLKCLNSLNKNEEDPKKTSMKDLKKEVEKFVDAYIRLSVLKEKYAKNIGPKLADVVDFSEDGDFYKRFLQPYALKNGLNVSEFSLKEKEEYFKATMEFNFARLSKFWPKFLGGIEKNPTEILMNVMCEKRDFEVLDFIEKNYDEIKEKLPSDWIGLVKKLYNLDEEQVAAIRECIDEEIIKLESIYGAEMDLGDLLGDRNMVFRYFMLCSSKEGGNLSLEYAKNKMDDKEFFESRIKRILDIYSIIFTDNAVNMTKDMRKEGFLK